MKDLLRAFKRGLGDGILSCKESLMDGSHLPLPFSWVVVVLVGLDSG